MPSTIRGSDNMDSAQVSPVLGTSQSASGTAVDFTGIPSWAKRITVMFSGVSTNGTSDYVLRLGDAGGIETSGYNATQANITTIVATVNWVSGYGLTGSISAATTISGQIILNFLGSNTWTASGSAAYQTGTGTYFSGSKTLSDTLTQIRITTANGTDTFDAGTINIMWE